MAKIPITRREGSNRIVLSKWRTVAMAVTIASAYVVWGALMSLLPPFYPSAAESRGATPSQYGFVFGIANLAAFLTAPLFGRYGALIGPKILYNFGAYAQAVAAICMGFLSFVKSADLFIGLSYFFRILSGIADVAAWGSVLSILIKLYPEHVARVMSWTEVFFGLGYMLGPALGSLLYSLGGFMVPFLTTGTIGLVVATCMIFVIPNVKPEVKSSDRGDGKFLSYREVFKYPSIFVPFVDNAVAMFAQSMIASMVEPHLIRAGADTSDTGTAFLIFGAVFGAGTFIAGLLCDWLPYTSSVSAFGNTVVLLGLTLVGPLPFLPLNPSVPLIEGVMAMMAIGLSFVMVSSFGRAQAAAGRHGFVQDLETYLLISGMWSSSFYFGNFLGSTLAGFTVDAWGFRSSSILFWCVVLLTTIVDYVELSLNVKNKQSIRKQEYEKV